MRATILFQGRGLHIAIGVAVIWYRMLIPQRSPIQRLVADADLKSTWIWVTNSLSECGIGHSRHVAHGACRAAAWPWSSPSALPLLAHLCRWEGIGIVSAMVQQGDARSVGSSCMNKLMAFVSSSSLMYSPRARCACTLAECRTSHPR